jgi:hypothetical protein
VATYNDKLSQQIVRQIVAATTQTTYFPPVPFAGVVSAASLLPATALTGDATNNRVFTLKNGATTVATLTTTANQVAGTPVAMALSGTPANLAVAAGDNLSLVETVGGTGVVHGGYQATVTIARTDQP